LHVTKTDADTAVVGKTHEIRMERPRVYSNSQFTRDRFSIKQDLHVSGPNRHPSKDALSKHLTEHVLFSIEPWLNHATQIQAMFESKAREERGMLSQHRLDRFDGYETTINRVGGIKVEASQRIFGTSAS
jgi:hypothetical protein